MADKTYTKIADSIVDALNKIDIGQKMVAKGVIKVSHQKKKAEVYLWPWMLKRLLVNKLSKELFQKRMIGALK